jgi:hypothetical protein
MPITLNKINDVKTDDKNNQEILQEALSRSIIGISREVKLKRIVGGFAIQLAKKKGDPLYRKLIRFRRAWKAMNRQIQAKYRGPATLAARQAILKTKENKDKK